jgi:squalene cyclase
MSKNMGNEQLERLLRSIGKRCFENCYSIAEQRNQDLSIEELIQHDPDLEGTSPKGFATRLSLIKKIFREKKAIRELALELAEARRG